MVNDLPDASSLPKDIQAFLQHYPGQPASSSMKNIAFHENVLRMQPDNMLITTAHKTLAGNYDALERKHGYIQWFFPIRAHGMNAESYPLTLAERNTFRVSPALQFRWRKSLAIMLDFYGIHIRDQMTLTMGPVPHYGPRYKNLMTSTHNYLRITRILKSASEFGLEHYNVPILLFFLHEQSRGELVSDMLMDSMDQYWINCVRDVKARGFIHEMTRRVRGGGQLQTKEYIAVLKHHQRTGIWHTLETFKGAKKAQQFRDRHDPAKRKLSANAPKQETAEARHRGTSDVDSSDSESSVESEAESSDSDDSPAGSVQGVASESVRSTA